MPSYGDKRADGFTYVGMYRPKPHLDRRERWLSPDALDRYQARRRQHAKTHRDGLSGEKREAYLANAREATALRRASNPVGDMLTRARHRAKVRGIAFDITEADVTIPAVCPVLGIQLARGKGCATDASPELDRVDNSGGYTRGNVIVVSRRANRIKNDATPEELMRVATFFRDHAGSNSA